MNVPPDDPEGQKDAIVALGLRIGFVVFVLFFALQVARPFLGILAWAAVLTVSVYPLFDWAVERASGHRALVAIGFTLAGLAIAFGPLSLLAVALVDNLRTLLDWWEAGGAEVPAPDVAVRGWPVVGPYAFEIWSRAHNNLGALLEPLEPQVAAVGTAALGAAASAGWQIVQFAIAVLLSGFLLFRADRIAPDTRRMAEWIGSARGAEVLATITLTIRQVSRGVIGVSLLQTLLAGIGLMVAGIPAAGLIAFGTLVLAISQIGPNFLLIPVAIWSFTFLEPLAAVLFSLYIVPVSFVDNLLKPIVFSRGLATPMWVIILGVFGGTIGFGLIGIFVGPVVLAIAYDFFRLAAGGPAAP
jgi:predicted PurR-regulated permease PerM